MTSVLYLGCPIPERSHCQRELGNAGLSVVWADSITMALAELRHEPVPILIDLSRGAQAVRHAHEIRTKFPLARVFAVVDSKRPQSTADALLAGINDVFSRPLSGRSIATAVRHVQNRWPCHDAWRTDPSVRSQAMRDAMAIGRLSSTMRAGVLIRGEDGTGRQFLARSMHASQNGNGGPFVVLDCAAHAGDALDFLLFGSPAASNGFECLATSSLLLEATGGTLYLRHVALLPDRVQARLARVLRQGEAWLQGSGRRVSLDVRPVAGVEPGFQRLANDGGGCGDLVRVVSAIGIELPPLRQRREDIPGIARELLREICTINNLPSKTLSRPALALLAALPWRGNVSELRAVLEGIVSASAPGHTIALDDIVAQLPLNGSSPVPTDETLKKARARFEREYIAAALEHNHGRISDAADALGIRRTNLYRKIRSLRIVGNALRS